jgi:hypothetical protein
MIHIFHYTTPRNKNTAFALLVGFILLSTLGVSSLNQSVLGHNFAPNESASFLTLLHTIQAETQLVEENILNNRTLAMEHAENAVNLLTKEWIDEIAEKNQRVATDLSNAIIDLRNATTQTEIVPSAITEKISEINDIASEAISARISKADLSNSTIQALVVANIANEIYSKYADALGISPLPKALSFLGMSMGNGSAGAAGAAMNMHSGNATSEEKKIDLEIPRNVTNELAYQTAQGLVKRAQYVLNNDLKPLVTSNLTDTINDVNSRLAELGTAIDNKVPFMDVLVIIHANTHPKLISAFHLPLRQQ